MEVRETRMGRFDQVRLLTTKNIKYLSAPPDSTPDPNGIWSISSVVGNNELLCVHNSIIIRVPVSDVLKIADYSVEHITRQFGKLSCAPRIGRSYNGEKRRKEEDRKEGPDESSVGPSE